MQYCHFRHKQGLQNTRIVNVFVRLFLFSVCTVNLYAIIPQDTIIPSPSLTATQEKVIYSSLHRIGWGVSISEGFITFSNDYGEVLISMLYAYRIAQKTELELALHYTNVQRYLAGLNNLVPINTQSYGMSVGWQADITWIFQPFNDVLQPLRLGIGPSMQFWSLIITQPPIVIPYTSPPPSQMPLITEFRNRTSLAINTKVEWLLVQQSDFDVGIRAQVHLFADPFSGGTDFPTVGGMGSLGFFIYLRF
jgi:hypothetical protein